MATAKKKASKKTAKKVVSKKAPAKKVAKKVAAKNPAQKTTAEIEAEAFLLDLTTKMGRPTLYKPEFCQEIVAYFDIEPYREVERFNEKTEKFYFVREANRPPTIGGFARKIGVSRKTLYAWAKSYPDFEDAMGRCQAIIEDILVTNGLLGLYDSRLTIFAGKNYTGLRDIKETLDLTPPAQPETPDEIQKRIDALGEKINRLKAQL